MLVRHNGNNYYEKRNELVVIFKISKNRTSRRRRMKGVVFIGDFVVCCDGSWCSVVGLWWYSDVFVVVLVVVVVVMVAVVVVAVVVVTVVVVAVVVVTVVVVTVVVMTVVVVTVVVVAVVVMTVVVVAVVVVTVVGLKIEETPHEKKPGMGF